MANLRYPIGMQTFSKIIEGGYTYIDKTRFIPLILNQGQFVFLSRPRRFGKSLITSTLKAYFEGRRELFSGLAIEREEVEWTAYPVLHFDFNSENYSLPGGLDAILDSELRDYERIYGRHPEDHTPAQRFKACIFNAYQLTGKKVVILIDEYDKPLLGLENFPDIYEKNQRILKSFFGNLKSMDEYIRFGFITGVARFSKVSIFSDLNNLDDISMEEDFADICGLTEEEVLTTFQSGIAALAKSREESYEATVEVLRDYYDGYLFHPKGSRLYNPFSILKALKKREIDPFWYETGSPTFLVESIRNNRIDPMDINGHRCTKRDLQQVRFGSKDPIPLMFQTGYLTIDRYDRELQSYTLRFPNREVEIGFAEELLPMYVKGAENT